jgi:hypothetical protein
LAPAEPIGHNNTIRNKDMLHVEVVDSKGKRVPVAVPAAPARRKSRPSGRPTTVVEDTGAAGITPPATSTPPPPNVRRSARERAPVDYRAIEIAAQKALNGGKKKKKRKASATAVKKSPSNTPSSKKRGIFTLGGGPGTPSSSSKRPRSLRRGMGKGRRVGIAGQQEAGERIAAAMATPAKDSDDPLNKFFRFAMKSAVRKQYDITRANNRFKSVLSGDYDIRVNQDVRRLGTSSSADGAGGNEAVILNVRFKKGPRSWEEEQVDAVSKVALAVLVKGVLEQQGDNGKELLKPHRMAEVSARTFWSIVRHYGPNIPLALSEICPEVDFSFLSARAKRLSEKALINLERAKARELRLQELRSKRAAKDLEKAKKALEADSKGKAGGGTASSGAGAPATSSAAAPASEPGPTGLPEHQQELHFLSPGEIGALNDECDVQTTEQLADADANEVFDELSDCGEAAKLGITLSSVVEWIETAREEQLLPIMARIVGPSSGTSDDGGGSVAFSGPLLTILAANGVIAPRDLTVYKPQDLHDKISTPSISVSDIEEWRNKAWAVLAHKTWLAEYFHVDNSREGGD